MLFASTFDKPSNRPVLFHLEDNLAASLWSDFQGLADSNND
jgi:hypothetical protein